MTASRIRLCERCAVPWFVTCASLLSGDMRSLYWMREAGYRVREGAFTLSALTSAEEAFTSSAVREIVPVIAVDGRELSRGEAATKLQALLEAVDS